MSFPKLKNPLLCRITVYAVLILPCVVFGWGAFFIEALHELARIAIFIVSHIALIVIIIKNVMSLMMLDILLASIRAHSRVRKHFDYPTKNGGDEVAKLIEKRLGIWGSKCKPLSREPIPSLIKYSARISWTIYNKAINKFVIIYRTELLDKSLYDATIQSAKINTEKYAGTKKRIITDKHQKKAPLSIACAPVIIASRVDEKLSQKLFDTVCKGNGTDDKAFLPCVIDVERGICVFNSEKEPYFGFGYSAKSRAYNLIKRYVFGGKLPFKNNEDKIKTNYGDESFNEETSLWALWRMLRNEEKGIKRKEKKSVKALKENEIAFEDDAVYIKIGKRTAVLPTLEENGVLTVTYPDLWSYPTTQKISKVHQKDIERRVTDFMAKKGHKIRFDKTEDEQ